MSRTIDRRSDHSVARLQRPDRLVLTPTFLSFFQLKDAAEVIWVSELALSTPTASIFALLPDLFRQSKKLPGRLQHGWNPPIPERARTRPPLENKQSPAALTLHPAPR